MMPRIPGRTLGLLIVVAQLACPAPAGGADAIDRSPAAMRQRLQAQLHRLVEDPEHYGPAVLWVEDHKKVLWFQGQAVAMLAATYPEAAEADKPALQEYLRREITQYLLDPKCLQWETKGTLTRPGNEVLAWEQNHAPRWLAVYALHAYAQATGDWTLIDDNARLIQGLCGTLMTPPNQIVASRNVFPLHNAWYSGAWAMGRLAERIDDDALRQKADAALAAAREAMLASVDEDLQLSAGGDGRIRFLVCLEALTPEAARVYAEDAGAKAKIAALVARADAEYPFWWLNGLNLGGAGGEGSFQPPQFATQVFLAKAWILDEPYADLARQLPWPNVYATMPRYRDLHYLRNLAALLEQAPAEAGEWAVEPVPPPSPSAAPMRPVEEIPAASATWHQFLGGPCRTGEGSASFPRIQNPRMRWKVALSERPMLMAHPIVVDGTVYVANMDGTLTAFDAGTGERRWQFRAGGAIGVCPAVVDRRVHFGSLDGFQYCLDTDGRVLWRMPTGAPILSAPCVVGGRVFFGNEDGAFFALSAEDGAVAWRAQAGDRILSNPAYFDGKVYFASDDMHAYAFSAANGQLAWKRPLTGESNRWNSPTVVPAARAVLFTSVPHQPMGGMGMKDLYGRYYLGHVAFRDGKWSHHPFTLTEALTAYAEGLERAPDQRSVFLLDAATGEEQTEFRVRDEASGQVTPFHGLPMNLWYHNGNNRPVVWQGRYILVQAFGNLLKIDPVDGWITETYPNGIARGDEYTPITIWDNTVYAGIAGNIACVDLATGRRHQLRGVYGVERADFTPIDTRVGRWGGGTGDGGSQNSSFIVICDGRLYYSVFGWLYCFDDVQSDQPEPRPWEQQP